MVQVSKNKKELGVVLHATRHSHRATKNRDEVVDPLRWV